MIEPDVKDWTWVLQRPCPECDFDASACDRERIGAMVRANAGTWVTVLTRPDVARRPAPDVWSALEYAAHVRDVFRRFDRRLELMLTEDDPQFENWDQDATALAARYGEQDPAVVTGELQLAAETIAARLDAVSGTEWARTGTRSDGSHFTVDSFARYFVHDPVHHLHDVGASGP